MATGHGLPISGARLGPTRRDDSGGKAAHSRFSTPAEIAVGSSGALRIGFRALLLILMKMPRLWVGAVNSVLLKLAAFCRVS